MIVIQCFSQSICEVCMSKHKSLCFAERIRTEIRLINEYSCRLAITIYDQKKCDEIIQHTCNIPWRVKNNNSSYNHL